MRVPERVIARVSEHIDITSDGCWVSRYSVGSHGYAQVGWREDGVRTVGLAHRVAWIGANGPIPDGHTVDHQCKNRRCVNPAHLRLLTNFENARRTAGRDRPIGTCANGHPNSNLSHRGKKRVCGICRAKWDETYRAKRRAAAA